MKDNRPVNLEISSIQLPLAAYASILHRISGVLVFAGIAVLLYLFDQSLSGPEGFARVGDVFSSPFCKLLLWGTLSALAYHFIAGCKHLLMDLGIGENKEQAPRMATAVLVLSVIVIVLLGVWIW
jgi:succinate dehydrogenase / fumarate reductase cytochrome b subunit